MHMQQIGTTIRIACESSIDVVIIAAATVVEGPGIVEDGGCRRTFTYNRYSNMHIYM